MKKLTYSILFSTILLLTGCMTQSSDSSVTLESTTRYSDFQEYRKIAKLHSNYLDFALGNLIDESQSFDKISQDELIAKVESINNAFIAINLNSISNSHENLLNNAVDRYFSNNAKTRSQESGDIERPMICQQFQNEVDSIPMTTPEEFCAAVENILFSDSYESASEDEFIILAVVAATWIDSFEYWAENYLGWVEEATGTAPQYSGFWDGVWKRVKRLALADAEAAVDSAIIALLVPPFSGEVLILSAGLGSLKEGVDMIKEEL